MVGGPQKESLQRVLDSSRSDVQRLQHRLRQLMGSWDTDGEMPALDEEVASTAAPDDAPSPPPRRRRWRR
jgi:diguanylate cyclase